MKLKDIEHAPGIVEMKDFIKNKHIIHAKTKMAFDEW